MIKEKLLSRLKGLSVVITIMAIALSGWIITDTIEHNNQVNHDTTLQYFNCIIQGGLTANPATPQNEAKLATVCLEQAGVRAPHE